MQFGVLPLDFGLRCFKFSERFAQLGVGLLDERHIVEGKKNAARRAIDAVNGGAIDGQRALATAVIQAEGSAFARDAVAQAIGPRVGGRGFIRVGGEPVDVIGAFADQGGGVFSGQIGECVVGQHDAFAVIEHQHAFCERVEHRLDALGNNRRWIEIFQRPAQVEQEREKPRRRHEAGQSNDWVSQETPRPACG